MRYTIEISKRPNGKFRAYCPDLGGGSKEDYNSEIDALTDMCQICPGLMYIVYRSHKQAIPLPSGEAGEYSIRVPLKVQAKILLWNYMVENKIRVGEMAKLLGVTQPTVSRLTDMSKDLVSIDAIESALAKLGVDMNLSLIKQA